MGRPQIEEQRPQQGETLVDVARTYGVDPTTIGRFLMEARNVPRLDTLGTEGAD